MLISSICRKTQRQMFLLVSGGHICAPQMDTNIASLDKALQIWVKRFSEYLAYEISHKPDSFVYSSSFIFQILDFLYWIVCNSIFDGVTVKTENCLKLRESTWPSFSIFAGSHRFFYTNGLFPKIQLISGYQKLSSSRPALVIGTFYYNMHSVKAHSTLRDNYM